MKKIVLSILGIFVAVMLAACSGNSVKKEDSNATDSNTTTSSSGTLEKIKQNGVIRIGVFGDKPPFGYIDAKGVNQGYDVYFAKRIAKELFGDENKVEFVLVEAANRVEFLKSDKVDVILANFTKTPQRAEQVDFAAPYMKVALGVVVPSDSNLSSVEELKDKTLILNKGTTADIYFYENYPDIKTLKFDQNTETFAALIDGRGEALSHDNTLLFAWVKENPNFKVAIKELGNQDVIAPAVKKGNDDLRIFIDELIVKLAEEQFFHKAYEETLKVHFSDDIKAEDIVIEGGKF
ncbi:cysteine ABC transporter substrate-binding protein [Campylobacter sp. US33a]|uniref:cysteine ABC transporter substrate-binding protein n=1 Tax=Campylobacter sp. US33a TaxID=2498120 RepID=UPI00106738DE|nr:cysteine ABC transporter substrate-binding protein [Campylobacter sp. US33a]TEY02402.1 transporter substrate-binding domain-containing protein [Campylobacter sp. US33a]